MKAVLVGVLVFVVSWAALVYGAGAWIMWDAGWLVSAAPHDRFVALFFGTIGAWSASAASVMITHELSRG